MRRCRHRYPAITYRVDQARGYVSAIKSCLLCGEVLGLGPSNDELGAVQIEIRAAELAAAGDNYFSLSELGTGEERQGWIMGAHPLVSDEIANSREAAGYLARCIVRHDTEEV